MSHKAVILGAGITGLSTAWKLSENRKYQVMVIEKQPQIGGVSSTFKHGDLLLDYGPHKIYTQLDNIMEELRNLMGEELLTVPKKSTIRLKGKFFNYPFQFKDLILGLNPLVGVKCILSYVNVALKNIFLRPELNTYEDWIVNRFGKELYNMVFRPQAQKIWGNPANLSSKLAQVRIAMPSLKNLILNLMRGSKGKPHISADVFYYPKEGISRLSENMVAKVRNAYGEVLLNSTPLAINLQNNKVESITIKKDNTPQEIESSFLVSTIPINQLIRLIRPECDKNILLAANSLRFRALVLIYLVINKERVSEDCWIFFPEERYLFNRLFEQKAFSNSMIPANKTVLCLDLTCEHNDELWNKSDEEYREIVTGQLEETRLIKRGEIEECFTVKINNVYPVYDLNFSQNLAKISGYLRGIDNLLTIGRLGLFNYSNMDHCIDMGIAAAKYILSKKPKDEWDEEIKRFGTYKIVD